MQPGDTIQPTTGGIPPEVPQQQPSEPQATVQSSAPTPVNQQNIVQENQPLQSEAPAVVNQMPAPQEPSNPWQFTQENEPTTTMQTATEEVSWTASEFVSHQKSAGWYMTLGVVGALGAGVVYLLTKDVISAVMVVVALIILAVFAARKPRTLQYQITNSGIAIGQKLLPYQDFKSFAVIDEGAINSIQLMPLKRFMPAVSMYYAPEDENRITNALSNYLPLEERDHDMVDRLMKKIRF